MSDEHDVQKVMQRLAETGLSVLKPSAVYDCLNTNEGRLAVQAKLRQRMQEAPVPADQLEYFRARAKDLRRIITKGTPEEREAVGYFLSLGVLASHLVEARAGMDPHRALTHGLMLACVDLPEDVEEAADGESVH